MDNRSNFATKIEQTVTEPLLHPIHERKVAFHTLGCKLNFAESAMLMQRFRERGYRTVDFDDEADVYIINTCSVTHVADKKCRQAIKKATHRGARVVVMGCYAQLKPEEIAAIEGVNLVLGTSEKFRVIDHVEALFSGNTTKIHSCDIFDVEDFDASYSISERTRAFLKVQDGCNYNCTYCTIPLARGISRNTSIEKIMQQAKTIAAQGVKEVVLTGVNIGDFGHSTGETFFQLIRQLDTVEGIDRFRISSIEPNLLSNEIIDFVATSQRFVPHFHIPLQSGSNQILAAMGRRYRREVFASRVNYIRHTMPFACIGADVIVGFPGETDELFEETYHFIQSLDISYLHVFPFSDRPNTKAFEMKNKVEPRIKEMRSKKLLDLSREKRKKFYQLNEGRSEKVIFESRIRKNYMYGFTSNYIKVEAPYNQELIGKVTRVEVGKLTGNESCKALIL
ncbi:MAG: tRNA (N(6)-L-threonylcarbamoyladenosine(37)-C(2))-methylthiotransferase MtaB [Bacteroidales bacterium]|nr:tRNA (N(6)-L-threonylcarbamoyladenosine(37)-C(2))-methylthiotransferase MtaB [Bacteroidales bacterium]HOK98634.1 tRNA (N(6)-L-threonylcarbamoyladenosine(37)-C(2))-methylthiotransferase MtaB [Bacteroidales bacterium]HPO65547.1 tRNA (N(6)-L-threonylcarbamoyladenosine(37)-C(2))-methylthiotransferase MtaB [Bacteroidales bacterium]